jgi:hypothetical protein
MQTFCFLLSFLSMAIVSNAQLNDYNTIYAKTVDIRGNGKERIGKIGKIEGLRSYMFLKSCSQKKDSGGIWITQFKFCNPNHLAPLNFMIILQFDKKVDSVNSMTDSLVENVRTTFAENKLGTSYSASKLKAEGVLTMVLRSKKKIFTYITGIEGEMQ